MRKLVSILLIPILIVMPFLCLEAQIISKENKLLNYSIEPVSDLSFNIGNVNSVAQDEKGFIWFGSWHGLFLYDGYSLRTYKVRWGYSDCFKGRKIRTIFSDSKGRLWVGSTHQGLHLFNRDSQCFTQLAHDEKNPSSIPENDIMGIWEDSGNNIWLATTYGFVSKLIIDKNEQIIFENYEFDVDGIDFLSISNVVNDVIWIGTNRGVLRFDMKNPGEKNGIGQFSYFHEGIFDMTIDAVFNRINSKYGNELWIGSANGIHQIHFFENEQFGNPTQYLMDPQHRNSIKNKVSQFHQNEEDSLHLWVGTDDGIFSIILSSGEISKPIWWPIELFDEFEKVNAFCEDNSGVIWVGTNKAVRKVDKFGKEFEFLDITIDDVDQVGEVRSLAFNDSISFYASTHGSGIIRINLSDKTAVNLPIPGDNISLKYINTILMDDHGDLWAGTDGNGVFVIDGESLNEQPVQIKQHFFKGKKEGLSDDFIYSFLMDDENNYWIGTFQGGLNRYVSSTNSFIIYDQIKNLPENLSKYPIIKLLQGRDGHIWIGTRGNGVFIFKPAALDKAGKEEFIHLHVKDTLEHFLPDNFITDVFEDEKEGIWIGTESGLYYWDKRNNQKEFFTSNNGFPGEVVQSITSIKKNEIWVSTNKSVVKINLMQQHDSDRNKFIFQEFNYSDGIGNRVFNNNSTLSLGNNVMFGGADGITFFNPNEIKSNPHPPEIAITDIQLNYKSIPIGKNEKGRTILNKSINETDHISLRHNENNFTFEFAALHFSDPEKNAYMFKMEGFDEDWILASSNRRYAHYSNLDAGEYVFKVKASNNDGVWSEHNKELRITVLPPFWLTIWAYAFYGIFIIAVLLIIRKIALNRIRLKHRIEIEHLEREKSDELHRLELQYFTNISHEIRTPLTLILGPLEKLLNTPDLNARFANQLQLMQQHGQRLYRLLNQLMDFRRLGKEKVRLQTAEGNIVKFVREVFISFREAANDRNISYQINASHESIKVYFDRDLLEKILFNLFSNAFKYSSDHGNISVEIDVVKSADVGNVVAENHAEHQQIYQEDYLSISIRDMGQGISGEDIPHIFNRFFRVHTEGKKTPVGTGIGLALTKDLVFLHKGIVTVKSQINSGSSFSVFLPMGKNHLSDDEILTDFIDSENPGNYLPTNMKEGISPDNLVMEDQSEENARILIVEDNEDVRRFIKSILISEYHISEAANGKEGLRHSKEEIPDLIISDVMMPLMDGIELCGRLKRNEATSHIPIILLTARTSLIFKVEGMETGADDYITKPFSPDYLLARVKNLIDQRKTLKKRFSEKLYVKPKEITLNSLDEEFLNKVIEMINTNMSESEFAIEDMCREIGMSRMQLYRKLKALTGLSANEFLRMQRIQRAAQLLEKSQLTIAQITYEVGFNDLKYFRSRFTEHFNMSPSEYAKKSKQKSPSTEP